MSREELPKALATWYDYTKWVLDRVDGFPKNQRFVLGTRLADAVVDVMELLAEAAYARGLAKADLLDRANRRIESVRWLVRIVTRIWIWRRPFVPVTIGFRGGSTRGSTTVFDQGPDCRATGYIKI